VHPKGTRIGCADAGAELAAGEIDLRAQLGRKSKQQRVAAHCKLMPARFNERVVALSLGRSINWSTVEQARDELAWIKRP
jgi:hypothetical protein